MREAEIEAVRESPIPDLGLRLEKGEIVFIPEEKAKGCKQLWDLQRIGAVRVRFVERYRTMKPHKKPPVASVVLSRPTPKPQMTPEEEKPPEQVPLEAKLDPLELKKLKDEMREEVRAEVKEELQEQLGGFLKDLRAANEEIAQRHAVPATVVEAPIAQEKVEAVEPTFIPSDIVKEDTKGKIEAEVASTSGGGVDEAAQALKATRKKKPKKKKAAKKASPKGKKS